MLPKLRENFKRLLLSLEHKKPVTDFESELFFIYIDNHLNAYKNALSYLFAMVLLSYIINKDSLSVVFDHRLFFMAAFICFIFQYSQYNYFRKNKIYSRMTMLMLLLNKIFYSIAFLIFLFYPIHVENFYEHSLCYFAVFIAIIRFTSLSSVYLPFFLAEMAVYATFCLYVEGINYTPHKSSLLGPAIILVTFFYLGIAGLKNSQIAATLANKKSQLQAAVRQAEEAMRVKSEFLASISHEIRTPLSGIMGMINFLKQSELKKEQRDCIDIVDDCSKTLLNTLNDLLDASKMESGKFTIDKISFDIYHMVNNIQKLMLKKASEKHIGLELNVNQDLPRYILADPHRLHQIIMNLVSNAIKFTARGKVTLSLSMRHSVTPMIRFEISDSGIGITPEDQKKLFQNFSQVDSTISRRFGGTGLGLSIAKQLVELMGGTIGVSSIAGEGSTFWFEIPCIVEDTLSEKSSAVHIVVPKGIRILIAEDNNINCMIISQLLEAKGCRFDIAHNGAKAVELALASSYDLILMDVQMPEKDGLEATREIRRQSEALQAIPIIGLTANSLNSQIQECLDAGMVDHIAKPINPDILYSKIAFYAADKLEAETAALQTAPAGAVSTLAQLQQVLGKDYADNFLAEAKQEIRRLIARMQNDLAAHNFDAVRKAVHDLKGIGGTIDRADIAAETAILETLAQQEESGPVAAQLATLEKLI